METANPSRRNAIVLMAAAVPALAATTAAATTIGGPSREFLECKALWDQEQYFGALADKEGPGEYQHSRAFKLAYRRLDEAAEKLAATPHSKQKLKELLTLAAWDEKAAPGGLRDGCNRQAILLGAALETFEALGGAVHV